MYKLIVRVPTTSQINDTHIHAPLKRYLRLSAETYMSSQTLNLMHQLEAKKINDSDYGKAMKKLTSLKHLRNKSVPWMLEAALKVFNPAPDSEWALNQARKGLGGQFKNTVQHGWNDLYLAPARSPAMLEAAMKAHKAFVVSACAIS